jgi:hypothetical protein
MCKQAGFALIGTIMSLLFIVLFWGQIAVMATAVARAKTDAYSVTVNPYLPLQRLEPVY